MYYDDELPAGYQDADLEMAELDRLADEQAAEEAKPLCGHTAHGNGFTYICDLKQGHTGLHRQRTQLRDSVSTTNWGDDGLSMYATKYPENGSYGRRR